jgi:hypothetical protein
MYSAYCGNAEACRILIEAKADAASTERFEHAACIYPCAFCSRHVRPTHQFAGGANLPSCWPKKITNPTS